jgi:hypothetical protein
VDWIYVMMVQHFDDASTLNLVHWLIFLILEGEVHQELSKSKEIFI